MSTGRPQTFSFNLTDLTMGAGGTVNAIAYTVRIGLATSGTWYVNRLAATVLNGMLASNSIRFLEYL